MSISPSALTPDLLVAQSDFFLTNSGAFVSGEEALLIDPCMRPAEIDGLFERAKKSLDEAYKIVKDEGLWVEA